MGEGKAESLPRFFVISVSQCLARSRNARNSCNLSDGGKYEIYHFILVHLSSASVELSGELSLRVQTRPCVPLFYHCVLQNAHHTSKGIFNECLF